MIVVLYVDDLSMTGNHKENICHTKQMLSGEFEMIDLGLVHFYLGIEVCQKLAQVFITTQVHWRDTEGIWHG